MEEGSRQAPNPHEINVARETPATIFACFTVRPSAPAAHSVIVHEIGVIDEFSTLSYGVSVLIRCRLDAEATENAQHLGVVVCHTFAQLCLR